MWEVNAGIEIIKIVEMITKCLKRYELFEVLYINLSNWIFEKCYAMIHCFGIRKTL